MRNDFSAAMAQITAEKGLPRDEILNMVAGAMVSAYKRDFGGEEELVAELTPQTGEPRVFAIKLVVETVADPVLEVTLPEALKVDPEASIGISVRIDITPPSFGRIGAQAAKQTIMQRLREAERDHVYHDFIDREGDIVSGIFRRAEPRGMIVDLGRVEALVPPGEQVASERFRIGTRLRALLLEVNRAPRGYLLVASRAHKGFVRRLLELEIPEIYNGSVEIRSIAREPGSRTKVAVQSHQIGLDPVGACVGQRGIRIQNVVNEIGGEKIDVVRWHKETPTMVASALGPARVHNVELSEEDKTAYVTVPHAQFSLAIGKEGQNARLAARLTGWRIDIKSDQPSEEGEAVASAVASPSEGTGSPGSPAPSEEGEAVASAVASPSEGTGSPGSPAPSEEGEAVASAVASPSDRLRGRVAGQPGRSGMSGGRRGSKPRHVPQRTCIGCRRIAAKKELVRIVRTPEGHVEVDETGKRNGRGAYIHRDRACWSRALRRGAVERALKTALTELDCRHLAAYEASLSLVAAAESTGAAAGSSG